MDHRTFDAVARVASRRRILGSLAATVAAVAVGRTAIAAPSTKAVCMQTATATAKTCRKATAGLKGRDKAAALKVCQATFKAEKAVCLGEEPVDGGETGV